MKRKGKYLTQLSREGSETGSLAKLESLAMVDNDLSWISHSLSLILCLFFTIFSSISLTKIDFLKQSTFLLLLLLLILLLQSSCGELMRLVGFHLLYFFFPFFLFFHVHCRIQDNICWAGCIFADPTFGLQAKFKFWATCSFQP